MIFLADFTIYDGEHEYSVHGMIKAETMDLAERYAKAQEHEAEYQTDHEKMTCWDGGDGTTASKLDSVQEITYKEADILTRLGVVNYL